MNLMQGIGYTGDRRGSGGNQVAARQSRAGRSQGAVIPNRLEAQREAGEVLDSRGQDHLGKDITKAGMFSGSWSYRGTRRGETMRCHFTSVRMAIIKDFLLESFFSLCNWSPEVRPFG